MWASSLVVLPAWVVFISLTASTTFGILGIVLVLFIGLLLILPVKFVGIMHDSREHWFVSLGMRRPGTCGARVTEERNCGV